MKKADPGETSGPEGRDADFGTVASPKGMSPYATGGGGVTFERKVAVQYLAHLLVGDGAIEFGEGRRVVSVAFQQAPGHPVDDLVVSAALSDESQPSLVLALGIRRSPNLVLSDESTRKLIREFVRAVIIAPTDGPEHRLGLVVSGPQQHAEQLAKLASLAVAQMDAPGFFDLVCTPNKFDAGLRCRLDQLVKLVECALHDLGVAETDVVLVQQRTWQLLSMLTVLMPRLESPNETDWSAVQNSLVAVARGTDLTGASQLRDRLVSLANEYPPKSARVDLKVLRRDAHATLDSTVRRHRKGWKALDHLHGRALASVCEEIIASDDDRRLRLDRSDTTEKFVATAADNTAIVVSGESGVGKSALALLSFTTASAADPNTIQALCINLRQVPKLTVEFEARLGCPISSLLCELSAPQRMLIVDAADAVAEGMDDALRYLVDAAKESDVKVIAVTSNDSKQVVQDTLIERLGSGVTEYVVDPLSDAEIDEIVKTFTELRKLKDDPRSHELLRRLVVVDLLIRGRVCGIPLNDADAMREVWSGLVRRREAFDRGAPDKRESILLQLADLELNDERRLEIVSQFDPTALAGLRKDGLLRTSLDDPFTIGPEFAHDELRRYSVARLLLADSDPASRIRRAGSPRWSLAAARLACQSLLARSDTPTAPLRGRFATLQTSFDSLVDEGHGARWGDVPGEALLTLANASVVLRNAWPKLLADDAAGLKRIARLVCQRHRDDNGFVDIIVVEPIITLLLEDDAPWGDGEYAQSLLRDWLQALVVINTAAGHPLRILLRKRLVEACAAADRRLTEERKAAEAALVSRTPEEVEQERQRMESDYALLTAFGYDGRRRRSKVPSEITDEIVLELLALLGPDLAGDGEAILRRVAQDAPSRLAPAVDDFFAARALATCRRGASGSPDRGVLPRRRTRLLWSL